MKTRILTTVFSLLLISPLAFSDEIRVEVNGMVCAFCAQGIQKKFDGQEAVESIDVQLGERLVTIKLKNDQALSDEQITKLITEAGYEVQKILR